MHIGSGEAVEGVGHLELVTEPEARVEGVNGKGLFRGEGEVEDLGVGQLVLGLAGHRDDGVASGQAPVEHHLHHTLVVLLGQAL